MSTDVKKKYLKNFLTMSDDNKDKINMEYRAGTYISKIISVGLGIFFYCFGQWDILLQTLLGLVILDFITGWIKAIMKKELSSSVGAKGFVKKVYLFTVVAVTNLLQPIFRDMIPLRETIIMFYIINEALSILENASYFIPIPLKLKNILYQLREEKDIEESQKIE